MTYDYDFLQANFEDAKEEQSKGSAKTLKRRHSHLERGKET